MENLYRYFDRDISWLSFNYRVLLEADNDSLPLYERINFIAIYSSNLEEFYKVRVAEHKAVASGGKSDGMSVDEARRLIHEIKERVNAQLDDRVRIYEQKILPALRANHIIFIRAVRRWSLSIKSLYPDSSVRNFSHIYSLSRWNRERCVCFCVTNAFIWLSGCAAVTREKGRFIF